MLLDALAMHPGTFYRYFEHKDDLYCMLVQNVTRKSAEYYGNHNQESLSQVFMAGLFDLGDWDDGESLSELEVKFTETVLSIPESILLYIYLNVLKGESSSLVKDILRRMRFDGYLRPDIDDDLISFMFEAMQFNLILFFRESGIEDLELQQKVGKYFAEFFCHGLVEDHKYSEIMSEISKSRE
jgi:AcrR family transcriptional regulator